MDRASIDYLSADQWRHVAIVASTRFVKLYVNGALVATEHSTNNWIPTPGPVLKNFLGRSVGEGSRQQSRLPRSNGGDSVVGG